MVRVHFLCFNSSYVYLAKLDPRIWVIILYSTSNICVEEKLDQKYKWLNLKKSFSLVCLNYYWLVYSRLVCMRPIWLFLFWSHNQRNLVNWSEKRMSVWINETIFCPIWKFSTWSCLSSPDLRVFKLFS